MAMPMAMHQQQQQQQQQQQMMMMTMMMQPPGPQTMMTVPRGAPTMQQQLPGGAVPPPIPGAGTSSLTSSLSWTEHDAPDGRKYYYNRATKKSTYEKPKELYTARERFVDENCAWKATYDKTSEKYYYYNRETKETRWEMPEELRRTEKRWEKMNEEKMKRENTTAIGKEGGGEGGKERAATAGAAAAVGRPAQHTHNQSYVPLRTNSESALTLSLIHI